MEISIETPQQRFDEHLNLENNNRILFSGKFGTGKSYFLKKYFEQNADKYNLFWISPVDYVVGANQDIFEWIKIDIAKELLTKYLLIEDGEKFSNSLMIGTYIYNTAGSLITKVIERLSAQTESKIGVDVYKELKSVLDGYKAFEKSIEAETKSPFKKLADHIDKQTQIKGSIYEDDLITQILRTAVQVVNKTTHKECVIVIDDLDRLDPDHIFRILNILSAHNNHFDSNKFEFNRVIAVCDVHNIEHLFKYRYGPDSDFEGYIEKYYTFEPFHFDIIDSIRLFCKNEPLTKHLTNNAQEFLAIIFASLVKMQILKIRNIKKVFNISKITGNTTGKLSIVVDEGVVGNFFLGVHTVQIDHSQFEIIEIIKILILSVGGKKVLKKYLNEATDNSVFNELELQSIIEIMCIPHHIAISENNPQKICYEFSGNDVRYKIDWPMTYFLNSNFRIPLKWSKGEKYFGGDYFQNLPNAIYYSWKGAVKSYPSWSDLSKSLLRIINYLEEKSII